MRKRIFFLPPSKSIKLSFFFLHFLLSFFSAIFRSIRRPTFPIQHDLIISANRQTQNLLDETKTEPKSGINSEPFESYKRRNIYTSCSSSNTNCPPHIYRHDGEFGRDRYSNSLSQVREFIILSSSMQF